MQENENPQFEIVKIFKTEYKVPLAKPEEVEECEQEIYALCHIFLGKIATISDAGLTVVLNKAMKWDVERGLLPSQIPHKIYKHLYFLFCDFFYKIRFLFWYHLFPTQIWFYLFH